MYTFIYLISLFNILMGLYSLKINYKSRVNILFSILAFFSSAIMITNILIIIREYHLLWEKFNLFFVIWVPTFYIIWVSEITSKKLIIKKWIIVLISIFFSFSIPTNLFIKDLIFIDGKFSEIFGPLFDVFFLYYSFCFIYGLIILIRSYKSSINRLDKNRTLYIFTGTLIPITTSILTNFILRYSQKYDEVLRGNILVFPLSNIIMMCFFGYSVIKYNFLKEDITVKEHLDSLRIKIIYVLAFLALLVGAGYVFLMNFFGYNIDYAIIRTSIILMIVITLVVVSINYFLGRYIKNKIIEPIEKISGHAVEVGKGNFNQKVGFEGEDEIAILSRQMDEMTEKLKKTSQIRENFNKALQIEVQNKTEKLQDAYNKLKESDKAKKDFIDAIAHEIYNPLAVISLSDEFINWETITPENKKMIKSIHRNVKRLISLVKEIEDFNLSGLESQKLNIERFDINELINLISQDFIILGNNKKIKISTKATGQDFYLEGDKEKLTKVFINLIENALNFSNEMSNINIEIEESKEKIKVHIKDNGIGIRKEDIGNIFDKFYRAKVDDELRQGIGLGLPTSLEIVTKHDGLIKVESEYGKGSTFTVILPKRHVIL